MQNVEIQPHARLRPALWATRLTLGRCVLTLSVNRDIEREEQPAPIANRVAELRRKRGLSRQELAGLLSIHPTTLAALEDGTYLPSLRLALRVSEFFAQPVDALFFTPIAERLL